MLLIVEVSLESPVQQRIVDGNFHIVLAAGIYMVVSNCFGSVSASSANFQAIIITAVLVASMFGYKHFVEKKPSPILLIVISAAMGIVVYGI